jgi:hypothetical protein
MSRVILKDTIYRLAEGGSMEQCRGVMDWMVCLKCKHICTPRCPIEREDAIVALAGQLRTVEQERE